MYAMIFAKNNYYLYANVCPYAEMTEHEINNITAKEIQ